MERLVLGVIAVIVMHIAFSIYMANVMQVGKNIATVDNPGGMPTGRIVVKPPVDKVLKASTTPPTAEDPPATPATTHTARLRSKTPRGSSITHFEVKDRRRPRLSDPAKPTPAFALLTAPEPKSIRRSFGDRIIVYKADITPAQRSFTVASPSIDDDSNIPKQKKKNSLVAKLQFLYKKPWDLIKAVGSKLRKPPNKRAAAGLKAEVNPAEGQTGGERHDSFGAERQHIERSPCSDCAPNDERKRSAFR